MKSQYKIFLPLALSLLMVAGAPLNQADAAEKSGSISRDDGEVIVVNNDTKEVNHVENSSPTENSIEANSKTLKDSRTDSAKPSIKKTANISTEKPSEELVQKKVKEQKKTDRAMLKAANEVDGVDIDPNKFKEEKGFQLKHLNPFHWVFKPVTDMQARVVHLEKQIMRLEAPIASLQKPMVGLREDMGTVENQMSTIDNSMGHVTGHMEKVNGQMKTVDTRMGHMENQLDKMYEPVVELQGPVTNVSSQLSTLKSDLQELKDVVSLTSTLILVAVIAVGLLVAVGTPIAALFAWRHRKFIIEKFGKSDYEDIPMSEEETDNSDLSKSVTSYTR